ncbi:MAG: PDZ domain-containing protein, partial [Planctomycetes bacterium]|nr:PDZ domain-containing protein [Planctomycetota bacterium]
MVFFVSGLAFAQNDPSVDAQDELKAQILAKVEKLLEKQHALILQDVRELLDQELGGAARTAGRQPGFLGIEGKPNGKGVELVRVIEGTPAKAGGLAPGDVLTAVNGTKTASVEDLRNLLGSIGAGGSADVEFERNGAASRARIVLAMRPQGDDDDDDGDDDDDDGDDDDDDDDDGDDDDDDDDGDDDDDDGDDDDDDDGDDDD